MVELTLYILFHRLMNWGLAPVIATRTVAADAVAVSDLLSDPANQRCLIGRTPRDVELHVQSRASGHVLSVEVGRRGRPALGVTWILSAGRGSTEVDLAVQFETRGLATRLVLVLGGRRWLTRRLDETLARLARRCADVAENVAPAPASAAVCAGRVRQPPIARDAKRVGARPR